MMSPLKGLTTRLRGLRRTYLPLSLLCLPRARKLGGRKRSYAATETSSSEHSSLSRVVLLATLSHNQLVLIVVSLALLLDLLVALSDAAMILKLLLRLRVLQLLTRSFLVTLFLARLTDWRRQVLEVFHLGSRLRRIVLVLDREGILLLLNLALLLSKNLAILPLL